MGLRAVRAWLSTRADTYFYVVTALCLNVPVLSLVLFRHLDGVGYASLAGAYVNLVFLGYYDLILLVVLTAACTLSVISPRLAVMVSGTVLFVALFYLVVNGSVYRIYRFHVDAFWLEYVLFSWDGLGIPTSLVATGVAVLLAIAGLEYGLFSIARRLHHRKAVAIGFMVAAPAALVLSQAIHVVAYYQNDARITDLTPRLPFYYPLTSYRNALKYGELTPLIAQPAGEPGGSPSLRYPLAPISCPSPPGGRRPNILMLVLESWRFDSMDAEVSPNIHAWSRRSSTFLRHFSSGNSTPTGIFGLFYGLHATYWTAVKATSAAIDNPLLIDLLQANGYAFGIYADSKFERHKIKDTIFRDIEIHESFAGATPDARDRDMTGQLLAFIERQQAAGTPFFGFAFYKSTHYSYYYPEAATRFRPAARLNLALAGHQRRPAPYLNHYRNAVRYVDALVGEILDRLAVRRLLADTIVIITTDHGEEFNDNGDNYWGHDGNFTESQTRIPLVLYVPGRPPRRVTEMTAQIDVPTTLVQEGLGCGHEVRDYSNGRNLFGPLDEERPLIIGGYVNHAFLFGDDVFAVHPMYVHKYKVWDIRAKAGPLRPDLVKQAMEEVQRFYRPHRQPLNPRPR